MPEALKAVEEYYYLRQKSYEHLKKAKIHLAKTQS